MSASGHNSRPGGTEVQPHFGKVVGVSVAAAIGGLLFGFDTAVVNGAVDAIQQDFGLGEAVLGFTVAITLLGCAAGAWFAGDLADRLGRKRVMFGAAILFWSTRWGRALHSASGTSCSGGSSAG